MRPDGDAHHPDEVPAGERSIHEIAGDEPQASAAVPSAETVEVVQLAVETCYWVLSAAEEGLWDSLVSSGRPGGPQQRPDKLEAAPRALFPLGPERDRPSA